MKKQNAAKNAITGLSAVALLASFSPTEVGYTSSDVPRDQSQFGFDQSDCVAEGYTLLNYYNDGGLASQIAGTYASATQGALWGLVYGGAVGFGVGLAIGI